MSTNVTRLVPLAERPLSKRLAATIRAEMEYFDVAQADVAQALGVSQQAVSLKINGKRPIGFDELAMIAPLFDATAAELLAEAESGPRSRRSEGLVRPRSDSNGQPTGRSFAQVIDLDDYRKTA